MDLNKIKPYNKNAKLHPPEQIEALANIIEEVGWRMPILVNRDNVIVAGHGRFTTWLQNKKRLKDPWIQNDKGETIHGGPETTPLTEAQEMAYRLADNKLNESEWDRGLVIEEMTSLEGVHAVNVDCEMSHLTGFDIDDLKPADIGKDDDEVPEPPEVPKSKLGEVYQLGEHFVMCGDATKLEDVDKLMNGMKVDLFLTDPPYNVDYTGKTKDKMKIKNDKKNAETYRDFLKESFTNAHCHMKDGAAFYVWHADSEGYSVRGSLEHANLPIRQYLIWAKDKFVMGRQDYHWQHEPCLYGWKEGAAHYWGADRTQSTLMEHDRPSRNDVHPTMKPVSLIAYLISNSTKKGGVILDLFGGAGSTLIAAHKLRRRCYMMELSECYVDVIIDRWCKLTGQYDIQKNGKAYRWKPKAPDIS